MSDRSMECWRLLFNLVDDFREQANAYNRDSNEDISNVTVGQMRVLKAVAFLTFEEEDSDGVMLKTLAEKVNLTPGAVSIIVDSLVRQGLLERGHCPTDRRAVNIHLSEQGRQKIFRYTTFFQQRTADFLNGLSPADQNDFIHYLKLFYDKIKD